jgi:hypothetical protein
MLRYGFRFSTIKHTMMSERICVIDVDFYTDRPGCVPLERRIPVQVKTKRHARNRLQIPELLFAKRIWPDRCSRR